MRELTWSVIFVMIAFVAKSQTDKVLSAGEILKLIPDRVAGFSQTKDSQAKVIAFGDLRYSMVEKRFSAKKQQSVKILLFDYKEASIMYNQATRKFNTFTPVESDSLILRSVLMKDCVGWESYNVQQRNSQILLGICNRFFLTAEGTNVDLESLKKVIREFNLETFPK